MPSSEAMARYKRSEKGMATRDRYNHGAARQAAAARYRATVKGKRKEAAANARRIFAGRTYLGKAESVTQAKAITAYARERLHEFVTKQASAADE
jgi:hypothetical protein